MSQEIQNMFSQIAKRYDLLNHLLSFNIDKLWRKKAVSKLSLSPEKPYLVLDLCAGTLDLSIELTRQHPELQVIALDFCYPMLSQGWLKLSNEQKSRIHLFCGDALQTPFDSAIFDAVICGYGFRNLDDKQNALCELNRILKKDGKLVILDFFKPQKIMTRIFHFTYGRFLLPLLGGLIAANKSAYTYLNKSVDGFMTASQAQALLKSNGYPDAAYNDFFLGISSMVYGVKNQ